jgi:hemoglobin
MAATIFERYGGFASVSRVVSSFYDKLLESPSLSRYFENTDMRKLIDHQTKFIATVMGGPASYTDDALERVHAHLNISERDFLEAVSLLKETLEDFDFDDSDIATVSGEIMGRKRCIVIKS